MAEPTRRDLAAERRGKGEIKPTRHGRLRRHRAWPRILQIVGTAVVVVLVASVSVTTYVAYSLQQKISANAVDLGTPAEALPDISGGEFPGGFNMLVVGVDNAPGQHTGAYGERGGTLNDVNILIHVSADHKSGTVVSIPRDMIIAHPSCTSSTTGVTYGAMSAQPVNVAYSRGGLSCVVTTIEYLTGLSIPYAAQLSFAAVEAMTDAVGGVPVCLANDIDDKDSRLHLTAGTHVISGPTALEFLRTRHGAGDGSDLSRISLQQQYMSSLIRTITSNDTLTNPVKLYNLAEAAGNNLTLSKSLTAVDTMVAMARAVKTLDLSKLTFITWPGHTGDKQYPGKYVPNVVPANALIQAIKNDTPVTATGGVGNGAKISTSTPTPTKTSTAKATSKPTASSTPTPTDTSTSVSIAAPGISATEQTCARGYLQ